MMNLVADMMQRGRRRILRRKPGVEEVGVALCLLFGEDLFGDAPRSVTDEVKRCTSKLLEAEENKGVAGKAFVKAVMEVWKFTVWQPSVHRNRWFLDGYRPHPAKHHRFAEAARLYVGGGPGGEEILLGDYC
jgi:hypothetical protein